MQYKLSEALAQGYTHFMMGKLANKPEEFTVIELNEENLRDCLRRSNDEEYDLQECAERDMENYFGLDSILCSKPSWPKISSDTLSECLSERAQLDDTLVPASLSRMAEDIEENEDFKKGLELINKAMAEYKSYTDTDILVVLD